MENDLTETYNHYINMFDEHMDIFSYVETLFPDIREHINCDSGLLFALTFTHEIITLSGFHYDPNKPFIENQKNLKWYLYKNRDMYEFWIL